MKKKLRERHAQLSILSIVIHQEETCKNELHAQGCYTPRYIRSDCKEKKRDFEPREILCHITSAHERINTGICFGHFIKIHGTQELAQTIYWGEKGFRPSEHIFAIERICNSPKTSRSIQHRQEP